MTKLPPKVRYGKFFLAASSGLVLLAAGSSAACRRATSESISVLGEESGNMRALKSIGAELEKQAGISVQFKPESFEAAQRLAEQDLAAGTGTYDILLQYNFSLSSFVHNNWVFNEEETFAGSSSEIQAQRKEIEEDLFPAVWREIGHYADGEGPNVKVQPIGLPFGANSMVLVYNRGLFSRYGAEYQKAFGEPLAPPKTWQAFRRIAQFFTRPNKDESKSLYGLVLEGAKDGWMYYEWVNFVFSQGGAIMDKKDGWGGNKDTPLLLTSPNTLAATNFYLSLKPFTQGDFFSMDAGQQVATLKKRQAAMAIVWSDYLYSVPTNSEDKTFGYSRIPGDKAMIAGGIYYVNRSSRHKAAAAKFIVAALGKQNQVKMMQQGMCSPRKSVYQDPTVRQNVPYADALGDSLAHGVYMNEAGPDSQAIQEIVTTHLQRLWQNRSLDVATEMKAAEDEIREKRMSIFKKFEGQVTK